MTKETKCANCNRDTPEDRVICYDCQLKLRKAEQQLPIQVTFNENLHVHHFNVWLEGLLGGAGFYWLVPGHHMWWSLGFALIVMASGKVWTSIKVKKD